jgi:hypothetical protein
LTLVELLAQHGGVALKNSLMTAASLNIQHKLSLILDAAYSLFRTETIGDLV